MKQTLKNQGLKEEKLNAVADKAIRKAINSPGIRATARDLGVKPTLTKTIATSVAMHRLPSYTAALETVQEETAPVMRCLAERWQDEREYEDIKDYAAPINDVLNKYTLVIQGVASQLCVETMTKRPFGFTWRLGAYVVTQSVRLTATQGRYEQSYKKAILTLDQGTTPTDPVYVAVTNAGFVEGRVIANEDGSETTYIYEHADGRRVEHLYGEGWTLITPDGAARGGRKLKDLVAALKSTKAAQKGLGR